MKTGIVSTSLFLMVVPLLLVGCSSFDMARFDRERAQRASSFEVIDDRESQIPSRSDLAVELTVKIPREEPFPIKGRPVRSVLSFYPIVVNIDGQGGEWPASCALDKQNYYVDGKRNPERGEGFECFLHREVRLKPGSHVIYIASFEDRLEKEIRIDLAEGTLSHLVLKPIYRRDRLSGRLFVNGLSCFEAVLNGRVLP